MVHAIGNSAIAATAVTIRKNAAESSSKETKGGRFSNTARFNGAEGRGFAFGKRHAGAVVTDGGAVVGSGSNASSQTQTAPATSSQTPTKAQPTSTPVTVTLSSSEAGKSTVLTTGSRPGAHYAVVGAGGDGVTNPHNIKGVFVLNDIAKANVSKKAASVAQLHKGPLVDKVSEFLKKRGEITDKAGQDTKSAAEAGKLDRKTLESFGLLPTPKGKILNIHDDRFDTSKFTGREAVSLELAAGFAGAKTPVSGADQNPGKHLGQDKTKTHGHNGHGKAHAYGQGHELENSTALGGKGAFVSPQVVKLLRGGLFA